MKQTVAPDAWLFYTGQNPGIPCFNHDIEPVMDLLTAFPYWGIIIVIIVNAVIVSRMTVHISEQPEEEEGEGGGK